MRGKLPLKTLPVLSLVLTLWPAALALADTRKPNDFELAYTAIALDTLSDQLCAKISADAETTAPFNSSGTQVYRERSRCFLYVAVTKPDPGLCREVIEVEAWLYDGSYFSPENCTQLALGGKPFNFGLSFDHELILKAMEYHDEEVEARFPRHNVEPAWLEFYLDALRRRDEGFFRRLRRLPDYSS